MAMDFSSLDLLASTALSDNNPSQLHASSLQHKHHSSLETDNEDDDDEADNKNNSASLTSGLAAAWDWQKADNMGSVKCGSGKHKKGSSKPVVKSIYVRDGKCVGRQVSLTVRSGGSAAAGKDKAEMCKNKLNNNALPSSSGPEGKEAAPADAALYNGQNSSASAASSPSNDSADAEHAQISQSSTTAPLPPTVVNGSHTSSAQEKLSQPTEDAAQSVLTDKSDGCENSVSNSLSDGEKDSNLSTGDNEKPTLMSDSEQTLKVKKVEGHEDSELDSLQANGTGKDSGIKSESLSHESDISTLSVKQSTRTEDSSSVQMLDSEDEKADWESKSIGARRSDGCSDCDENRAAQSEPLIAQALPSYLSFGKATVTGSETKAKTNSSLQHLILIHSGTENTPPSFSPLLLSKLLPPAPASRHVVLLDHCYACAPSKRTPSLNTENTDDSADAFESADETVSADDIEHRPRSLSVDSMYLQYGVPATPSPLEGVAQADKSSLLSPAPSVDSVSNDSSLSEQSSVAGGHFYSILMGCQNSGRPGSLPKASILEAHGSEEERGRLGASLLESNLNVSTVTPKCGKFQIGTFGSFSNSHLDFDTDSRKSKLRIGIPVPPDGGMKSSLSSPALGSPGSPFPLLQSPGMEWDRSDAGSEAPDDLDSSAAEDRFLSSSHDSDTFGVVTSQIWHHPVFHDHDYCCKEVSEILGKPIPPASAFKVGKRKYTKRKDRLEFDDEKLKKSKYLKRELLKQDNRFKLGRNGIESKMMSSKSPLLGESLLSKPNPVGRPRKRLEKQMEEYDAETGTKMKITGKYQDQYVYYYSKTSRNRRRKVDDKMPTGDRIILPAPKPGDIVVPHLTDADCEAIRKGGRQAFKSGGSYCSSGFSSRPDNGDMIDTSIVNTILSMEDNWTPPTPEAEFDPHLSKLTSEQVDLLIDCLGQYDDEPAPGSSLDFLTSAEPVPMVSTALDSLAATTVEEDFLGSNLPAQKSPPTSSSEPFTPTSPVKEEASTQLEGRTETVSSSLPEQEVVVEYVKPIGLPPTSRPSVEKNLEYLTSPFIKSHFFHEPSSASNNSSDFDPVSPVVPQMPEAESEVNETPWIVTVTLFDNDIPAIVINDTPFVRLVDIHKQILPAKDTGILKKRCQLMSIQVGNCTEMQRYFLVQYGRAQNSKSTLVISKQEAYSLIAYYALPQPRHLRGEEGAGLKRNPALFASLGRGHAGRHLHPNHAFAPPRKRGGFRRRGAARGGARSNNASPEPASAALTAKGPDRPPPSPLPAQPAPAPKRLRHKKINFREMLKGEDSSSHTSSPSPLPEEADAASLAPSTDYSGLLGLGKAGRVTERNAPPPSKRKRRQSRKGQAKRRSSGGASGDSGWEPEINVEEDSPVAPSGSVKSKKRSPCSQAAAPTRSPKSKLGLIKVNVKSLVHSAQAGSAARSQQPRRRSLFGRKSSVTSDGGGRVVVESVVPINHSPRVLPVTHRDAESQDSYPAPPPHALSPVGEVHLDLYKQAASECVMCQNCKAFLSVSDFLKHQHCRKGSGSADSLVPLKRRRVLVPLNKNICAEEQHLWKEFQALQAQLDSPLPCPHSPKKRREAEGPGEEEPSGEMSVEDLVGKQGSNGDPDTEVDAVTSPAGAAEETMLSVSSDDSSQRAEPISLTQEPQIPLCTAPLSPSPSTHSAQKTGPSDAAPTHPPLLRQQSAGRVKRAVSPSSVRVSGRKRKNKRFFDFENYEFTAGAKKGGPAEDEEEEMDVDPLAPDTDAHTRLSRSAATTLMHESQND